jgi:hypothetical protein
MALFKKVGKALAALGNNKGTEGPNDVAFNEEEYQEIHGNKIAASNEGIIFAGIDDLNGYLFLETIVVSRLNIKTFNGATLKFSGASNFTLPSDTQEIESDASSAAKQYTTKVSFDITQEQIEFIKDKKYDTVVFEFKKKSLTMFLPE